MKLYLLLIPATLLIASCSSQLVVLKPQCHELNWFERGRQDGMQGQPSNNWTMRKTDCETITKEDIQNYMDGWNHGLAMFCTEDHGFATAKAGFIYKKTCPDKLEENFLRGYEKGLSVYMIEKETTQIISQIENTQDRLKDTPEKSNDHAELQRTLQSLNEKKTANLKTLEKYNNPVAR